jgi:hypothetical protein
MILALRDKDQYILKFENVKEKSYARARKFKY